MRISYSHKFIFIHVYKVAGTSISVALQPYCYEPDRIRANRLLKRLGVTPPVSHPEFHALDGHAGAAEVREALPPVVFNNFFKFAFVRNPWDWQVSLYEFALNRPGHDQHSLFKSFGNFERYLEWRVKEDRHLQKDFLVDESGELLVDFVGRFERIEQDFETVCQRIGVRCRLPYLNHTPHRHYSAYYTPRAHALVADAFREDIEMFGYQSELEEVYQAAAL
ncbi:MAG TPA: sulfotransferase family 2 domain-containing protein [Pyrinomonadaceae bacterium]|nr:sulfotransferase family 2 domain-containing protein [Pyrinomonadaceae bacterium]